MVKNGLKKEVREINEIKNKNERVSLCGSNVPSESVRYALRLHYDRQGQPLPCVPGPNAIASRGSRLHLFIYKYRRTNHLARLLY